MMTDATFAVDAENRRGARGATPRSSCGPRRSSSLATSTRRSACSRKRRRWPRHWATPIPSSTPKPSLRCSRWIVANGLRPPHISTVALATVDEYRMDDYPTSVLAFAAAARFALHRGDVKETERQLTRAMRARPTCSLVIPWLAVRVRLHLARVYVAIADQNTARHLLREIDDIMLHGPALGVLDDEVSGLRQLLTSEIAGSSAPGRRRSVPPSCACSPISRPTSRFARSASGCSCLATRSAPRSARSIGSWASRHEATRCNRRRRSVCSADSAATAVTRSKP